MGENNFNTVITSMCDLPCRVVSMQTALEGVERWPKSNEQQNVSAREAGCVYFLFFMLRKKKFATCLNEAEQQLKQEWLLKKWLKNKSYTTVI